MVHPGTHVLGVVDDTENDPTYRCGMTWPIGYDDYDGCGDPAIACSLNDELGRCYAHLDEFLYLESWGWIPKPVQGFEVLDVPGTIGQRIEEALT